jgi:chromosomal replication initiator protein
VRELNPKLTFDQFVIGDGNRLAHAAALAVAEMPGQAYNPLFVYGPPGVGKSHLLQSIANYVVAYGTGLTVRLTSAERFTNDFVAALRTGEVERFKHAYRHNDVLLIDDVQFLESKARTEEEFFHTFNALYDTGGQIVLTSDRLPQDLRAVAERLRERFESGLVCDVQPPDRDTRMTILRKRVLHDGIDLHDTSVLDVIADRITDNVRVLEGALIRVVAYASLTGREVDGGLAGEVLDRLHPATRTAPGHTAHPAAPTTAQMIARIQEVVCEQLRVSHDDLLGPGRAPDLVWARQLAMHLARAHTDASLPVIARAFGGRNHTTVLHALRRATARLEHDQEARETVRALTARLSPAT